MTATIARPAQPTLLGPVAMSAPPLVGVVPDKPKSVSWTQPLTWHGRHSLAVAVVMGDLTSLDEGVQWTWIHQGDLYAHDINHRRQMIEARLAQLGLRGDARTKVLTESLHETVHLDDFHWARVDLARQERVVAAHRAGWWTAPIERDVMPVLVHALFCLSGCADLIASGRLMQPFREVAPVRNRWGWEPD